MRVDNSLDNGITKQRSLPVAKQTDFPDTPGGRIRKSRMDRNLFIVELAKQVNLNKQIISMIERGAYTPKIKTLKKLSEALDVPIWYLGCFENLPEDTLGQRLKKARLYAGLLSSELAQILSASHRSVGSWERDEAIPSPENQLAIDEFIRIQLSD